MYPLAYFWTDRDKNNGRSETEAKSVPGKHSANRADEPDAISEGEDSRPRKQSRRRVFWGEE